MTAGDAGPGRRPLHMGDDFFAGRFPFVDLASGGSVQGLTRAVEEVLDQLPVDVRVIPGPGPLSTVEDLREYHRMLVETTAIVRERMEEGQSLEEVQAAGLPDVWQSWGTGFISTERWLGTVYQSLAEAR